MRVLARLAPRRPLAARATGTVPLTGVWPIMATPFDRSERVDLEAWQKSLAFMRSTGAVSGVTILGVLGESNRVLDREREMLIRSAVEILPDVPVCVGTSHPGTVATVDLTRMAQELGAAAVMVTPSKEPTPNPGKIFEYYALLARTCPDMPIVLQDHPASTGVHMSMAVLAKICREVPTIKCVKLESVPTPTRIRQLKPLLPEDREVTILTGLGALYGFFDVAAENDGFMTGFAFPEVLHAMNLARAAGDLDKVFAIYRHFLPLMVFEQQPGTATRKELYKLRGLIPHTVVRHPGSDAPASVVADLEDIVARVLPGADITKPIVVDDYLP